MATIVIGHGSRGCDPHSPECPLCWATDGGAHGGFCPNRGIRPHYWERVLPGHLQRPDRGGRTA
jgi:hypothetical protein